jgi:hypothetical protein
MWTVARTYSMAYWKKRKGDLELKQTDWNGKRKNMTIKA